MYKFKIPDIIIITRSGGQSSTPIDLIETAPPRWLISVLIPPGLVSPKERNQNGSKNV